jgi:thymidylate kinase
MSFVCIDGIDGVGKGEIIKILRGDNYFDVDVYEKNYRQKPEIKLLKDYDTITCSEPSYSGVGNYLREELLNKDNNYSNTIIAKFFALDRLCVSKELTGLVRKDKNIIQSRSILSSIIYQTQDGSLTIDDIINMPGNNYFLNYNMMDHLIIPLIDDPQKVIDCLSKREKEDNCIYENIKFQKEISVKYKDPQLKTLMESYGAKVHYLDVSGTLEETIKKTKKIKEIIQL